MGQKSKWGAFKSEKGLNQGWDSREGGVWTVAHEHDLVRAVVDRHDDLGVSQGLGFPRAMIQKLGIVRGYGK